MNTREQNSQPKETKDKSFIEHVVKLRRVTQVTKGGKRFSFSAFVISGNEQGQVGFALGRSREVSLAIAKATNRARKNMIVVPLRDATIPYPVEGRHGACKVVILPASKGTGNIAGGAVRAVLNAAGIHDALTKSFGSTNGLNVAKATMNALAKLRPVIQLAKMRGTTIEKIIKGV